MSMISKDGLEQVNIIKNALDSLYDKLTAVGEFDNCKEEFEAIAGIVEQANTWQEV
jgi:hypothetical protein